MTRAATPTGGVGHPFEGGTIQVEIRWDGSRALRCVIDEESFPHGLSTEDQRELQPHYDEIAKIVYRAWWRTAHAQD